MCFSFTHNKKFNKRNFIINLVKFAAIFQLILFVFAFFNFSTIKTCSAENNNESLKIEEELEETVDELLKDIDFSELEDVINEANDEIGLFDGLGFKEYVSLVIKGEETISIQRVFDIILAGVKNNLKSLLTPLIIILVVVLITYTFNVIKSGKISGVNEIVYFVCFSIVIIIISTLVNDVVNKSKQSIQSIQKQMSVVFPILLSMLTTMGGVATVSSYSPMLAFLSGVVSSIFVYVLLPLFSLSLILSIVGHLSENTKLDKFNGFIKSLFKWVIGVVFAVFMGYLSIKGLTAGASDGLSIKATKYAIKNYIPMLGGYISEGFELVKAGGMLIKNATGMVSILLLFTSVITPIITVGILELGLKLLAGTIETVGDKKSSNLIYSVAGSLKLLIVVLVGVALMYFFTIFLLICSASNFV